MCAGEWCEMATVTPILESAAASGANTLAAGIAVNTVDGRCTAM